MGAQGWVQQPRHDLIDHVVTLVEGGATVALVGPAGIGKSTLVADVAAALHARGEVVRRLPVAPTVTPIPWSGIAPLVDGATGGDAFAVALANVTAARSPRGVTVLVVEDADHLDEPSAAVLHQLASTGQVTLLLTMRSSTHHPLPISHLLRQDNAATVTVPPLPDRDAAAILDAVLPGIIDQQAKHLLISTAGGVPLYLRELVFGSRAAGVLAAVDGVWRFAGSMASTPMLEELVAARFASLDSVERDVVGLIATAGSLDLSLVADAIDLRVIERLERAGVVVAHVGGAGTGSRATTVELTHPLYADVLRASMGVLSTQRHYRTLAEAAIALAGRFPIDEVRRAVWHVRGGVPGHAELIERAAVAASRVSDSALAAELSVAALERAWSIDATYVATRALATIGDHVGSERVLLQALEHQMRATTRCSLVLQLAEERWWWARDTASARQLLDDLDPGDAESTAMIRAQHAVFDVLDGDLSAAEAIVVSLRDDPSAAVGLIRAIAATQCATCMGRAEEGLEIASDAFRIASEGNNVLADPTIYVAGQIFSLVHGGRLDEARAVAGMVADIAAMLSSVVARAWAATMQGFAELFASSVDHAVEPFTAALALWIRSGSPGPGRWAAAGLALAHAALGDMPAATQAIAAADAIDPAGFHLYEPFLELARVWVGVGTHDHAAAAAAADRAVHLARTSGATVHQMIVAHDLARLGLTKQAYAAVGDVGLEDRLSSARRQFVTGTADRDAQSLESAGETFAALGAALFAAESFALAADIARRAGKTRDFTRLEGLAGRHLTGAADTPPLRVRQRRDVLSTRERAVATLAGDGLTNRQIAARLVIGERTVETHLYNAFAKLGINARGELSEALTALSGGAH